MDRLIREVFELKSVDADSYSPLTLAYIGDCVYELTIRTLLVNKGNAPVNKLNKKASELAKAPTQSRMISTHFPSIISIAGISSIIYLST